MGYDSDVDQVITLLLLEARCAAQVLREFTPLVALVGLRRRWPGIHRGLLDQRSGRGRLALRSDINVPSGDFARAPDRDSVSSAWCISGAVAWRTGLRRAKNVDRGVIIKKARSFVFVGWATGRGLVAVRHRMM